MYSPRVSFAGSGTGASAAEIWEYELLPGVTAGDMLIAIYQKIEQDDLCVGGIIP
jgi:hypothetical protein